MEIYSEVVTAGNLSVEISVRKKVNDSNTGCWVHYTARNKEGRILWQTLLSDDQSQPKMFANVEDALSESRKLFASADDEYEFEGLANKELDKTLYYLSLL